MKRVRFALAAALITISAAALAVPIVDARSPQWRAGCQVNQGPGYVHGFCAAGSDAYSVRTTCIGWSGASNRGGPWKTPAYPSTVNCPSGQNPSNSYMVYAPS